MIDQNTDLAQAQAALDTEQARLAGRQSEIAAAKHHRLVAAHIETVAAARAAKDELHAIENAKAEAQAEFIRAQGVQENARNMLHWHAESKPEPYTYPLPAELAEWESRAAELRAAVEEANRFCGEKWNAYQTERMRHLKARDRFQVAADQEAGARAMLNPQTREPITFTICDGGIAPSIVRRSA